MYNAHFGFREKPFKLVPNPDFLFLSRNHEIALAHLTYAVDQGDGFVVITGEVGTGKTTLCRIFLERLGDEVESAYIFNPVLDSVQLLSSICNEFGLRTNYNNLKQLLDVINGYLIMKNQAGRKVILLIDEAQNLSVENLEMVRMLSNLETTRNKLLQIILVGQPELGDKLDSYELRQLAQRISLSAHLTPLGFHETVGYIQHRINIAAQRQLNLFARGAYRRIHRFSGGTPRLINIACDRALLTAFSLNRARVTKAIAGIAIGELASRGRRQTRPVLRRMIPWTGVTAALLIAGGMIYTQRDLTGSPNSAAMTAGQTESPISDVFRSSANDFPSTYKINPLPAADTPAAIRAPQSDRSDVLRPIQPLAEFNPSAIATAVHALERQGSRLSAVARILGCWDQPPPHAAQLPSAMTDADYFDIAARQYGLRMYAVQANWGLIKQLNMPAIVSFNKGDQGETVYMAMVAWRDGEIVLAGSPGQDDIRTNLESLLPHLGTTIYLFWKNTLGVDDLIGAGAPANQITAVKRLLRRVGYDQIDSQPRFDHATRQAILDFQHRNNLAPDGLVGPLTKMLLIQAGDMDAYPRLDAKDNRRQGA